MATPSDQYMGIVIMTCRNGINYSRACLKSLQAQTDQPLLILVVDNASIDGTPQWIRAQQHTSPNIMRITFDRVVSVSHMWNEALRSAWAMGFDQALVVNNDTELLPETHGHLDQNLKTCPQGRQLFGIVTAIGRNTKGDLVYGDPPPLRDNPDFSCFMIAKWAWERVGGFDEGVIGAYTEDCIMHIELHRHGIRAVCTGLPFLHALSGTSKSATPEEQKIIASNADGNRQRFKARYGCLPGTRAYEKLFDPSAFGMYSAVTRNAKPL